MSIFIRTTRAAVAATATLALAATACSSAATESAAARPATTDEDRRSSEATAVAKAATAVFHRVEEATDRGYALPPAPAPLHECISAQDGPGAMGLHFINQHNVSDTVLDPARPAALVYEPTRNGRLRLVAAEYVVFAAAWDEKHPGRPPRLFGRELTLVAEPNRYQLPAFYQVHAWLWRHNPHGRFADHNPRVSCPTAQSPRLRRAGGAQP